jgi:hypothetical protein
MEYYTHPLCFCMIPMVLSKASLHRLFALKKYILVFRSLPLFRHKPVKKF